MKGVAQTAIVILLHTGRRTAEDMSCKPTLHNVEVRVRENSHLACKSGFLCANKSSGEISKSAPIDGGDEGGA